MRARLPSTGHSVFPTKTSSDQSHARPTRTLSPKVLLDGCVLCDAAVANFLGRSDLTVLGRRVVSNTARLAALHFVAVSSGTDSLYTRCAV